MSDYFHVILICNNVTQIHETNNVKEHSFSFKGILRAKGVEILLVKSITRYSQFFNVLLALHLIRTIKRHNIRIVIVEFPWFGFIASIISQITGALLLIDEHNFEYYRFERMKRGNKLLRRIIKFYECFVLRSADLILSVSKVETELMASTYGISKDRILLVRNGIDLSVLRSNVLEKGVARSKLGLPREAIIFLFHGKLDYAPNTEAIRIINKEIAPRIRNRNLSYQYLFIIAGDNPPREILEDPIFVVTGVYPNLAELLSACDVVICPIISGGGTRIKIIESIASGKPVISTSIGAEGLENEDFGKWLQIADDWDTFCELMMTTASLIRSRQHFLKPPDMDKYDWKNIAMIIAEAVNDKLTKFKFK